MTLAEQNRLKAALEAFVRDATVSESAARAALGKTGIFTPGGKLSTNYGGPGKPSNAARKQKKTMTAA